MTQSPAPSTPPATWGMVRRIVIKGLLLFILCNLAFAATYPLPLEALGKLSLYNILLPGRTRLPYGENPAQSYNLSLNNLPAMFASHIIQQPKADDEFRVLLLGDSQVWGWLLAPDDTLSSAMNRTAASVGERRIVVYNLAYPEPSLTRDLLVLEEAMQYQPDFIVWPVTLYSFSNQRRFITTLEQHNPERMKALIETYNLHSNPQIAHFVEPDFWQRTIIGQRRELADLLRLQSYGFAWAATGIDQVIATEYKLRDSDFDENLAWESFTEPVELTRDDLTFDLLFAGIEMSADVPVLIINEPMFISDGRNSHLRYNAFYPRWVYDQYRILLAEIAHENHWNYVDWWDAIAPQEFTDAPVHLTPEGTQQVGQWIIDWIIRYYSYN